MKTTKALLKTAFFRDSLRLFLTRAGASYANYSILFDCSAVNFLIDGSGVGRQIMKNLS